MRWLDYWKSLPPEEQEAYAERCDASPLYIRTHLAYSPPRKTPRQRLMNALADQSEGKCSRAEVLRHFYPEPDTDGAAA